MKVLVNGASGYIGRAVVRGLLDAGHEVLGGARGEVAAKTLRARGLETVYADLNDTQSLISATSNVDAVIETASADHSASTTAFLSTLRGSGRTYIRTSGSAIYSDLSKGQPSNVLHTEDDGYPPVALLASRFDSDAETIAAAEDGVRSIIIRPSMIYGYGASEQLPSLLRAALRHGVSGYTGPGLNRYGNVFVEDLGQVYALALEKASAGSVYNIAADEMDLKSIAESIGRLVDVPARSFTDDVEAERILGNSVWVSALGSNSRVDSSKARNELGWDPIGPDLLSDIEFGSYRLWRTQPPTVRAAA
ncbi:NAD-dependent epimerase/dehydratase family protein [Arthrobacter ramosus]|uniref:NAD-dependent epimerase/dehydratase family protein n=1 Tax=Arthrobacter ramosus TaxID=1672 RepID=A0ABV5Y5S8_ARTRM|nr:NAD-dependent epimerase/dehydratase family protein [Arthrobacter ramosus]